MNRASTHFATEAGCRWRVLVTGAAGQLGQALARTVPSWVDLVALDRRALDITNVENVTRQFALIQPQAIINAAAYTQVDKAEKEPNLAFAVNRDAVALLMREAQAFNIAFLHVSTDYVFDGSSNRPYLETDQPSPVNVYGQSKLAGEEVLRAYTEALVVRTSAVFGGERDFVQRILRQARTAGHMAVTTAQISGPTPVLKLAHALWRLLAAYRAECRWPYPVLHYAGAPVCNRYQWACKVVEEARMLGRMPRQVRVEKARDEYMHGAARPLYTALDGGLIERWLGLAAPDWQAALHEQLAV